MVPDPNKRLRKPAAFPSRQMRRSDSSVAVVGMSISLALSGLPAKAAPPKLPVPCQSGTCGPSGPSFLQYGSAVPMPNGNALNITQTTSKAIVNWASFNIANGYIVNFIQPSATAAILNNIWSANPSVIAGQMKANGQVYLYNQNGIIFDKGAQVDVAGLTASTLAFAPVATSQDPDALFENGILSGNTAGQPPPPAFVAPTSGATVGTVAVNAGASLTAADGGRIMLLGSAVTNQGSISAPDGQVILGAANQAVYLAASSSPSLRGLLIEVNSGGTTGTVVNDGEITTPRGNITLAGLVVNQEGTLSATTSVSANGSIYLLAGDTSGSGFYYIPNPRDPNDGNPTAFGGLSPNNGGTLLLTPGSVTEVLPDPTDTATLSAPEQAAFIPSQVELTGRYVALEGNASIHAPGGTVNIFASANPNQLINNPAEPVADNGSIYLAPSSSIDVSGLLNVSVPVTQTLLQVTLETNDLQNDPLLRNGFLHGTTVTVDVDAPPTLFDITPYADNIGSGIDQILTKAGSIFLDATGAAIARAGSTLNVSGGSVAYQGGEGPSTTNLIGANGVVYNISTAPSDVQYVGIANSYSYTDPTWGAPVKGSGESYYAGYVQGSSAGSLTVESPSVYLRGSMLAQTVDGPYQRTAASLSTGGTIDVGCAVCTTANVDIPNYGLDGGVTFANNLSDTLVGNVVVDGYVVSSVNVPAVATLSPVQLAQSGFNSIGVFSNGAVSLPAGINVSLAANGSFTARSAQSVGIDGDIAIPGGSVSLETASTGDLLPHNVTVGAGAVIDVSGLWTNDLQSVTLQPGTAPIVLNGGSVTASAAGNVVLGAGSSIDVDGGGWLSEGNKLSSGSAGTISLAANFSLNPSTPVADPYTGTVQIGAGAALLGGSLQGGEGGTLSLQSGSITVGKASAGTPGELLLSPGFFSQGGFSQYDITGQNGVVIGDLKDTSDSAPVTISPLQQNLVFSKNSALEPSGAALSGFTQLTTLPLPLRAPASVSFTATASDKSGAETGSVTLAADAAIVTDPGASVELAASGYNGDVRVFGTIDAPAGTITLQLENPLKPLQSGSDPGYIAGQEIELGPNAVLAAPAYVLVNDENPFGYTEGAVLPGGTVSLLANKGFIQTDYGSLINVSGTVGVLDVVDTAGVTPTTVAGNAGTINIEAREGIVLQGNLLAQAATFDGAPVKGAAGGSLNLDLGLGYSDSGQSGTGNGNSQSGIDYPVSTRTLTVVGAAPNGMPAEPPSNQLLSGTAAIDVGTIEAGGFSNVALSSADTIAFAGSVALKANASLVLDAPLFLANRGAQVDLSSAYVAVGNYTNNSDYYDTGYASPNAAAVLSPVSGAATLTVAAQLIDIRGISGWSGFGQENFTSSGDIRFVAGENQIFSPPAVGVPGNPAFEGALNTSANVDFSAAQVYPTTATAFAINDSPVAGSSAATPAASVVTITSTAGATPATPLSAGGSLSINATSIDQGGIVRAPMGQIALNGVAILDAPGNIAIPGTVTLESGSTTSVSAEGLTIPYGATENGTQWTYSPTASYTSVLTQPPAKQISLNGSTVSVNSGAKLDLSGGGDLYAYEFIAGEGGSIDVLSPANLASHPAGTSVYTYAILPGLGSAFAPVDPQYDQGSPVGVGQTVTLSGVPGLAAGTYALLPARYALLPGAFAIQVVQGNSGLAAGVAVPQPGGAYLVAARFGVAGTSELSSLSSTVLVASDATVRTESQYTDSYANTFFSSAAVASNTIAPRLPADAGQLALSVTNDLSLNGSIDFNPGSFVSGTSASGTPITQQGLGGDVAITAQNLVVVNSGAAQAQVPSGTVQLNVQQLDGLDAQQLILGAVSTGTSAGELLTLGATQTVELKNTTALTAPEVILAALNSVTVDPNAQLAASGAPPASASSAGSAALNTLLLPGGGALLRVSSGAAATLDVDPATLPQNPTGTVSIGAAAAVSGSGSLLLYGSNTTTVAPGARVTAPQVGLYSSAVSLGEVPAGTPGLDLTSQLLGSFRGLTALTIGSSSTIDFYGALQLGTPSSSNPGLNSISLDASGLGGYGAGDKVLEAGSITLMNSSGAPAGFTTAPSGTGSLQLIANASAVAGSGQITLGAGDKTISGFGAVGLQAAGEIVGQGTGSLTVTSSAPVPVTLTSAALVGAAGSSQALTTTGTVTITGTPANGKLAVPAPGFGAQLGIEGAAIAQNGTIDLPAGIITLTATSGNVTLGAGSVTAAPGAAQSYVVTNALAAGGTISLASQLGNVAVAGGATVDVSGVSAGAAGSDAGSLSVSAPQGTFTFAGAALKGGAPAGQSSGNFTLDEGFGLGGNGFTALENSLAAGGFGGALDLRTRSDTAVTIAGTVQAASFVLTADKGSIEVTGTGEINTSGGTPLDTGGGAIALWAGNGISVDGGAQLLANAGSAGPVGTNGSTLAASGGDITLGTSGGNIVIAGGTSQRPTTFSMAGGGGASTDGTLTLRAPRNAADTNVQIQVQGASTVDVVSRNPVIVEGFKVYSATDLGSQDAGCGTGGGCDIADLNGMLFTDAQTFLANSSAIAAGLGFANVQIRPGIEVDSSGDLILDNTTTAWDLAGWNSALGAPVNLTLRAAGNLIFESSLSDGFTNNGQALGAWTFGEPGTASGSASYTLTAGADLTSANPLAVVAQTPPASSLGSAPNSGNVILTPGNLIRTGSGNIAIAAGGDVLLGYSVGDSNGNLYDNGVLQVTESDPLTAAIYTAGVPAPPLTAAQSLLFTPPNLGRRSGLVPAYPTDGGNISVFAADDIRSATSGELISDWLGRRGPDGAGYGPTSNTTWWIVFDAFEQGIGALGGGNLSLSAGRDMVNVGAVIPTTGLLLLAAGGTPAAADLLVMGGGNLSVRAGGSVVSGVFEDDWGNASISAGGALTTSADSTFGQETAGNPFVSQLTGTPPSATAEIYPILSVGNGTFDVSARTGISLEGVTNSTTLPVLASAVGGNAAFYPYANNANPATLNLISAGGDVYPDQGSSNVPIVAFSSVGVGYEYSPNPNNYFSVYPSTVNMASLAGSVDLAGANITLFPAAAGNLTILAAGAIRNDGSPYFITMSEANPSLVPNALAPLAVTDFTGLNGIAPPQQPLHQNDAQPISLVADGGNIDSGSLIFPKAANIIASGNITDLDYAGKNLNPSDVTVVEAGGDISYSTPTQAVTNALEPNDSGIVLGGPGYLEVLAGGSINLGDANGILTSGSLSDSRLSATGASMVVGAGLGTNAGGGLRQPDYAGFISAYLAPNPSTGTPSAYASDLIGYMQQLDPGAAAPSYSAALTSFDGLTRAQQLPLISQVLTDVLSATGLAHTLQGASYQPGYTAIDTLFPTMDANKNPLTYSGDLNLVYSQLKTEEGGDIDLLVPGGSVIVGVANPPASLSLVKAITTATGLTVPAEVNLGILALGEGAIQGFTDQDFTVNQSRILTLEGGDIILWASNGNIDAGKGAKSASGAPPPVIQTDANGNLFVDPSNAVSGSGIGQLLTVPGLKAGLVNLIAPKGDVNAGDAGIRVAGNLNIAAVQVIGASNITVVGTSTGVPVSEAGAFAGALSGANSLGDASKSALEALSSDINNVANYQQLTEALQPTFITVKMFCLGIECATD